MTTYTASTNLASREGIRPKITVVHIVPTTLPGRCGVGDYAVRLGEELDSLGCHSVFIGVGHEHFTAHRQPSKPHHFLLGDFNERQLYGMVCSGVPTVVLLHLSLFGYDKRAYPRWIFAFVRACRENPSICFLTVCHELWQKPALFSRRLYRSFLQRRLILNIVSSSHATYTNTEDRVTMIESLLPQINVGYLPTFSSVGEPRTFPQRKTNSMVIFGLAKRRQNVWTALTQEPLLLHVLGVDRIVDVGFGKVDIPHIFRSKVEVLGTANDDSVHIILSDARFGLIYYDTDELSKSSIFAAYAAHGMAVLNLGRVTRMRDGLMEDTHFHQFQPSKALPPLQKWEMLRKNLWTWYSGRSCSSAAAKIIWDVNRLICRSQ